MRVADYIALRLVEAGIRHVFMITGGGAMHLNDALTRNRELTPVFCHHEQACAMAAEAYGRLGSRFAALNVTTGQGGINALNGVYGAYVDSIGMVVVSGQVKRETLVRNVDLPLRQLGDQEVDIVAMVAGITKFATTVQNPQEIGLVMDRALFRVGHGRPGPVWIDVPIDVQGAQVDPATLARLDPLTPDEALLMPGERGALQGDALRAAADSVAAGLRAARQPVIMPGTGVRISRAHQAFMDLVDHLGIPVATAFNAHDVLADNHPCYVGRPGTVGDRAGNFAVQNADYVLVLGCRLNIRQISYNWSSFARAAHVVMIDVDAAELAKPTLSIAEPVHADLAAFLPLLVESCRGTAPQAEHQVWLDWCRARKDRYPVVGASDRAQPGLINPYVFADTLFDAIGPDDVVVTANATACVTTFQAARLKPGQRLFSNSGSASMGYDLPAAIGAAIAEPDRQIICLAGDGSIMMNVQELQTIAGLGLSIKIFLLNNQGYLSIRQTQSAFFADNPHGTGPANGVTFPDFERLAGAFDIPFRRAVSHVELPGVLAETLAAAGPQFCEIRLDPARGFAPKLSSRRLPDGRMVSSPLEDMAPFLDRDEFRSNMIIDPMTE